MDVRQNNLGQKIIGHLFAEFRTFSIKFKVTTGMVNGKFLCPIVDSLLYHKTFMASILICFELFTFPPSNSTHNNIDMLALLEGCW